MSQNKSGYREVQSDPASEWHCYDVLPRSVRQALSESPFEYSTVMVLEAWRTLNEDTCSDFFRGIGRSAEKEMVAMIQRNVRDDRRVHWQKLRSGEYFQLVDE